MTSPSTKRRDMDLMKLMMSDFDVTMANEDSTNDFYVKFHGPKDSPYENGVWKVHVTIPTEYPYKSPSIGFCNTIFHPNVDEASGSVCLDVINQTWSPMFDLVNIFGVFLPQLLLYPNASDPLNGEAASMMMANKGLYLKKVREYVSLHAREDLLADTKTKSDETGLDCDSMSEPDELSDADDLDMDL